MNPADTDASLDVCGDEIGSCRFLFKIDGDSTKDTDEYTIERACNGNLKTKHHQSFTLLSLPLL